jgi:hypothetical protein
MKDLPTTETSQCVTCGGRLRNAVFCPVCGRSSCSWACYMQHLAQHPARPGGPASYPSDPRRDEQPDQAGGQAFAR